MARSNARTTPYLALDRLGANVRLARRLPRDLAYRYHVLPLAQDGGRVTVAMADPDNAVAQAAVAAALGVTLYVVQSDQKAIDEQLAEVWCEEADRPLHLLVCAQANSAANEASTCALALGDLLGAHTSYFDPQAGALDALVEKAACAEYDLVILRDSCELLAKQLLLGPADCPPTSLLMARGFCWPLKRILLVVRGTETSEAALDWVMRLTRPSGAAVTVLAVAPPAPATYNRQEQMQHGLTALLNTDTVLGREMHRVARRLEDWGIEGTLRLRQGLPEQEIRSEVVEGCYDLIAVGADSDNRWLRWLMGVQVNSLLRWADRPVLIAKSTTA